jgi:hypothetical protein
MYLFRFKKITLNANAYSRSLILINYLIKNKIKTGLKI